VAVALAQGAREKKPRAELRGFVVVPLACLFLYLHTGDSLGEVWLFAQRFPVPGLIAAIPLLRMPTGNLGAPVTALALALGGGSTVNVCKHFIAFQLEEVGDFDGALDHIEPKKHVAALIYDKGSRVMNMAPFLHFGSYYQAEKGGIIQFSYSWT